MNSSKSFTKIAIISSAAIIGALITTLVIVSEPDSNSKSDKITAKRVKLPSRITLSKEELMDKIKGGWAGVVIGCTYGGPTEFRWRAKMIPDSENIPWDDPNYVATMMKRNPGLYDDI